MATALHKKILALGNIEFDAEVRDSDYIVITEWDTGVGFGPRGYFYLYDKNGCLQDIQVGELVDKSLSQKPPQTKTTAIQGPIRTKGRPKKNAIENKVKITKLKVKLPSKAEKIKTQKRKAISATQQKPVKQKRQYKMSDQTRAARAEAMRLRMKAYWEKKKAVK